MSGVGSSQAVVQTRRRFEPGIGSDGFYVMISDPCFFKHCGGSATLYSVFLAPYHNKNTKDYFLGSLCM